MKTVLIMRHAEAASATAGMQDYDRPLTDAGIRMADTTAQLLQDAEISPDLVIASAALRTTRTAMVLQAALAPQAPLICEQELYQAGAQGYAHRISSITESQGSVALFVGHNPGLAMLLCYWAQTVTSVPPCTLAVIDFETDNWQQLADCQRSLRMLIRHGSRQDSTA